MRQVVAVVEMINNVGDNMSDLQNFIDLANISYWYASANQAGLSIKDSFKTERSMKAKFKRLWAEYGKDSRGWIGFTDCNHSYYFRYYPYSNVIYKQ